MGGFFFCVDACFFGHIFFVVLFSCFYVPMAIHASRLCARPRLCSCPRSPPLSPPPSLSSNRTFLRSSECPKTRILDKKTRFWQTVLQKQENRCLFVTQMLVEKALGPSFSNPPLSKPRETVQKSSFWVFEALGIEGADGCDVGFWPNLRAAGSIHVRGWCRSGFFRSNQVLPDYELSP